MKAWTKNHKQTNLKRHVQKGVSSFLHSVLQDAFRLEHVSRVCCHHPSREKDLDINLSKHVSTYTKVPKTGRHACYLAVNQLPGPGIPVAKPDQPLEEVVASLLD
jgi:hypothetical protein